MTIIISIYVILLFITPGVAMLTWEPGVLVAWPVVWTIVLLVFMLLNYNFQWITP